jgi:hypothetical protein
MGLEKQYFKTEAERTFAILAREGIPEGKLCADYDRNDILQIMSKRG